MDNDRQKNRTKGRRLVLQYGLAVDNHSLFGGREKDVDYREAELLTFIDGLINGFGYSPGVQACIDAFNKREKADQIRAMERRTKNGK